MLLYNIGAAACFLLFRDAKSTAQREVDPLRGAFYGIWFGKGGIMLSRRRDLRRSLPVILSYQRISAKVLCIRESFMNPDVSYSGAFMLSTMLIFFTWRRMTKQTASVNSMVSATLSR